MNAKVYPSSVRGEMSIPSSKSHTIRALIIATMAGGRSFIRNPLLSEDCKAAMRIIRQFGAKVTAQEGCWTVDSPADGLVTPDDIVDVGNSGTTLYFMTSIAALRPDYTVFTGDESIRRRSVQPLLDALNKLGAHSSTTRAGSVSAPFFIKGPISGGEVKVPCTVCQYISSLMIAAPLCNDGMRITTDEPKETPYLDMTIKWLREAGIEVNYDEKGHRYFEIKGNQQYKPFDKVMPSDWSSVAFPAVAALTQGSELVIHNMDFHDSQGDAVVIDHLIKMGADICKDEAKGDLIIRGGKKLSGITMDLLNTPDALPILCVVGCMAHGRTVLDNVAGARLKETDRVAVMTDALSRMGADITATSNTIVINGASNTSAVFPAAIKGIKLQSGPIPKNFAITGEMAATVSPEARPQLITETISNKLTIVPVTMIFPKGAVAACSTISKAMKIAVRAIHKMFRLLFNIVTPSLFLCAYYIIFFL